MRCTSATSKARRALDRRRVGYASAWARKCGPAPPRGGWCWWIEAFDGRTSRGYVVCAHFRPQAARRQAAAAQGGVRLPERSRRGVLLRAALPAERGAGAAGAGRGLCRRHGAGLRFHGPPCAAPLASLVARGGCPGGASAGAGRLGSDHLGPSRDRSAAAFQPPPAMGRPGAGHPGKRHDLAGAACVGAVGRPSAAAEGVADGPCRSAAGSSAEPAAPAALDRSARGGAPTPPTPGAARASGAQAAAARPRAAGGGRGAPLPVLSGAGGEEGPARRGHLPRVSHPPPRRLLGAGRGLSGPAPSPVTSRGDAAWLICLSPSCYRVAVRAPRKCPTT